MPTPDPSTGSGSALSTVERADRRSRIAASILALLTAVSVWLSLGTVALTSGDTVRIAALPSLSILALLIVAVVAAATVAKLRLEHAWPLLIGFLVWLPYLPGRIANPFLVWQGPLEWFVWLAVAAGLVAARPFAMPNESHGSRPKAVRFLRVHFSPRRGN